MKHHQPGPDSHREVHRLDGLAEGILPFAGVVRGELEDVGGRPGHTHGQRAKVMQAGNPDEAGFQRLQDAGQEADACSVPQFNPLKTQVPDFLEHGASVRVTVGIPAGRN